MRANGGPALAGSMILCLLAGCGPQTGTVRGTVFYKDRPLPGGFVSYYSAQGPVLTGRIGDDGRYMVSQVPLGPAKISVQGMAGGFGGLPPLSDAEQGVLKAPPKGATDNGAAVRIPLRYRSADGSGLTYTVVAGAQDNDLTLKD